MASLGMYGPFKLDNETIGLQVTKTSAGNYAFGRKGERGTFLVNYVGRSDSDVAERLRSWIGETRSPLFKYSYASSAKAAFEKECVNYHDFSPPGNDVHPARPDGTTWKCPRCNIFG